MALHGGQLWKDDDLLCVKVGQLLGDLGESLVMASRVDGGTLHGAG
jgi:hypothetical protein